MKDRKKEGRGEIAAKEKWKRIKILEDNEIYVL